MKILLTFFDILYRKRQNIKRGGVVLKNIVLAIGTMLVVLGMFQWNDQRIQSNQQEITLAVPFRKNIVETVTLYGTVKEDGRKTLYANGNARIEEIYVNVGDVVKAGDPLVRLQPISSELDEAVTYEDVNAWADNLYQTALTDVELAQKELQAVFNQIAIGELQTMQQDLGEPYTIYSPIDGMIISVFGKSGDAVTSLFPTVMVTDLEKLSVRMDVSESVLRKIKLESRCTIYVPALSDASYIGSISHIDPYAKETGVLSGGGTYVTEVISTVNNTGNTLRPGYQATVKVEVGQQRNALLVPMDAIAQDENGVEFVMVWTGKQAYRQDVVTGKEIDDFVQIITGLSERQSIIRNVNAINFTESSVLYEAS